MKFMSKTIVDFIIHESQKGQNRVLRYVLPSYPPKLLFRIGEELQEQINRITDSAIQLEYGIAYRLGQKWLNGSPNERVLLEGIRNNGWYNETDNLTSLRNIPRASYVDCLIILLAGYEDISDKDSLEDFFRLDQQSIWEVCLKKSFKKWISEALSHSINPDDEEEILDRIDVVLKDLYNQGFTDLLGIEEYLENFDFRGIMVAKEAYRMVLNNLSPFGLPSLIGFESIRRKNFSDYIDLAYKFVRYIPFLDASNRKKSLEKLKQYWKHYQEKGMELDRDVLGIYDSLEKLLEGLEEYINTNSISELRKLCTADFVFINDEILGFKAKNNGRPRKKSITKLAGLPMEVFLRAIWLTLAEFKKEMGKSLSVMEEIRSIRIISQEYKHHFGNDEEELAKRFLQKAIGGSDEYLDDHLTDWRKGENQIEIYSALAPHRNPDTTYSPARNAEPILNFKVTITGFSGYSLDKKFGWRLGKNSQIRFLVYLFDWVLENYRNAQHIKRCLPVFSFSYMNELFQAKDEENALFILNTALEKGACSLEELLDYNKIDMREPLLPAIAELGEKYQDFIEIYENKGFYMALKEKYSSVQKAFLEVYKGCQTERSIYLAPVLAKAFLLIPHSYTQEDGWRWEDSLPCGVVTPLHPALMEMICHQQTYLFYSFKEFSRKGLEEIGTRGLSERYWNKVTDLARLKWPLLGILGKKKELDTNIRSFDYIHMVGKPDGGQPGISSRLLLEYEEEEEEIEDSKLFLQTPEASLIKQVLNDYCKLNPYASDGLSVGVYCGSNIQSMIAGLDAFLSEVLTGNNIQKHSLRLTIFSDSCDDTGIFKWVNSWKQRWEEAEGSSTKSHYANCRLSVFYRVISPGNLEQLERSIKELSFDLFFLNDFSRPEVSGFEKLNSDETTSSTDYIKFPILDKVNCTIKQVGKETERKRVLSNRRFKLGTMHAEIMASLKSQDADFSKKRQHVVVTQYNLSPWDKVLNAAHNSSAWVVCIDPVIDEKLLRRSGNKREIIGFGTGVGSHGEYNFTISTDQFSLSDIEKKISRQLVELFGPMEEGIDIKIAKNLIKEASFMAGLSAIKATGPSEYVRDFIAYSLVKRLLPKDNDVFCDIVISLDAFQHWLDYKFDTMRPDLLRLQAKIVNGYFSINAQIIECKLAHESEGYLEKARQQVEEGLNQLVKKFLPRMTETPLGITVNDEEETGYPPDQRYWWMQLHRLIASGGEASRENYKDTLQALERLSDGRYNIRWEAAVIAIWTNVEGIDVKVSDDWSFSLDNQEMKIYVVQGGKEFFQSAGLENKHLPIFNGVSSLSYRCCTGETSSSDEESNFDNSTDVHGKEHNEQSTGHIFSPKDDNDKPEISEKNKPTIIPIPKRILLGSGIGFNREVFWEFGHSELPNRHILIFGASGSGKTYTIQALLSELGKKGINSLIVDYTNGFTNNQLEAIVKTKLKPKQHIIRNEALPINPFRKQCNYVDEIPIEDTPVQIAQRVSGVFAEVYSLGEQQKAAIYRAIVEGVKEEGNSFNLKKLLDKLISIQSEGGPIANSASTVINKIRPFIDMNPFGEEDPNSWEKLYLDNVSRCHIIQLAGFMKDAARLITEFSLIDLYWYYRAKGSKDMPRVIVLDEIQNLDHRLESPLGQFLTEGRKFGISLILATQTLSNLDKDEKDRLFQASHKLFFKPADTEIRAFAQLLADVTNEKQELWLQRLSSLKRGECYSLGYAFNEVTGKLEVNRYFKIKIKSLGERF